MLARKTIRALWWLMVKDLTREIRTHSVWPSTLLLGLTIVFVLSTQLDLPLEQKSQVVAGLLWVAVAFAGMLALERSFSNEPDGCWQALLLYPNAPSLLFLAKMSVNLAVLIVLELLLIPAFTVITDVPLLAQPLALALVALLGTIGIAAMGTLLSAITAESRMRGGLLALLLLPLAMPVLIASAAATATLTAGPVDRQWWLWIQLLAVFAASFTTLGALMFDFVIED